MLHVTYVAAATQRCDILAHATVALIIGNVAVFAGGQWGPADRYKGPTALTVALRRTDDLALIGLQCRK